MTFSRHSNLVGLHSELSPSKYAWANYDDEKLKRVYVTKRQARRGDELHELAARLIRAGVKLPEDNRTLNLFVNESIGWRLRPEQPLFFSENAFGTADACGFRRNVFRVSDLKTGDTPSSMLQLKLYVALYCLEYRKLPHEIEMEMRIYQHDQVYLELGDPHEINILMDKYRHANRLVTQWRKEDEEW